MLGEIVDLGLKRFVELSCLGGLRPKQLKLSFGFILIGKNRLIDCLSFLYLGVKLLDLGLCAIELSRLCRVNLLKLIDARFQ